MSCDSSERSSSGPTVGRLSTTETMMRAGHHERQQVADGAGERIERGAHRILQDHPPLRQAAGARGHHVGPAQLVEQIGAHDPDQLRGAGQRQDQQRAAAGAGSGPAPCAQLQGASCYSAENRPPTLMSNSAKAEIHDDQCQQEVRDGQADEAEEGEDVVADRVLPHRRVDADRQGEPPGDDDGAERQQRR